MNECHPNLLTLANELLEVILADDSLDHRHLLAVRSTSRRLYSICMSSKLWKRKALTRWSHWHNASDDQCDWYEIYKKRHQLEELLRKEINLIAYKCHDEQIITNDRYDGIDRIVTGADSTVIVPSAIECLEEFLDANKWNKLTMRYYARLVVKYLSHCRLQDEIQAFLALPDWKQSPELGFSLLAYWMTSSYKVDIVNDTGQRIDRIAMRVLQLLQPSQIQIRLTHLSFGRDDWITDHTEAERILLTINKVLFTELNYHCNCDNYYDEKNVSIDKVLESGYGIPLTMCAIYLAIAARLGVHLEFVSFLSHFMLRWPCNSSSTNETERFKYIDVLENGKLKTREECLQMISFRLHRTLEHVSTKELLCVAIGNWVNELHRSIPYRDSLLQLVHALNLDLILNPNDQSIRFMYLYLLARVKAYDIKIIRDTFEKGNHGFFQMTPQHQRYLKTLVKKKYEKDNTMEIIKLRSEYPQVKFKIGDILLHKRYNFQCIVCGWDSVCDKGEAWILQNGINQLSQGKNQPFYNVLGADSSERYVAQENLETTDRTELIQHPELGRYFNSFSSKIYEPNEQMHKRYPEDCSEVGL
ncbi:F-box only protein 21 [Trichoplax sp. H2]|nr:F-box only protein 21 [Trichoplax sp. H2]|eukprot:RDD46504.1 F-box only protein 21 [Trichoplax sp. H2]